MMKAISKNTIFSVFQIGSNRYQIMTKTETWAGAEEKCKNNNGHLASIVNSNEKRRLENILRDSNGFWVGLKSVSGKLSWVDGSQNVMQEHLDGVSGDAFSNSMSNCARFVEGKWKIDVQCDSRRMYVCEYAGEYSFHVLLLHMKGPLRMARNPTFTQVFFANHAQKLPEIQVHAKFTQSRWMPD